MDAAKWQRAMDLGRRRCQPMPPQHTTLTFERTFTAEEWQRMRRGLVPWQMEDKWLIFAEDDMLYFHRSWSGFCAYQMRVQPTSDGYAVHQVVVNRDPEQYGSTDDEYDLALVDFLISNFLLDQRKPFPLPRGFDPAKAPAGLFQHHLAGTGYPEVTLPERPTAKQD